MPSSSVTSTSERSVVPPPISITNTTSPTLTSLRHCSWRLSIQLYSAACGSSSRVKCCRPILRAASAVKSRAAGSNEAGTVMVTSCSANGASGCA
ncbi:Uncharacterised protein [Vibrio cholerae]|nr:Uncharacterised protein [Vibrio cholerae]